MITSVLRNIFTTNLSVKKNERVLVFTDRPAPDELLEGSTAGLRTRLSCIAFLAAEIGKTTAKEVVCVESESVRAHGVEPPAALWEKAYGNRAVASLRKARLFSKILSKKVSDREIRTAEDIIRNHRPDAVNAVIALSYFSTSHTRFRDMLTRICGARYASMPLFDVDMLEGPMNVDWKILAARTKRIARAIAGAETIEIATPNGTSISFSVKGRKAGIDTGLLNRPGAFGNLPAGEVYIAPVEGTANGRLVLEWSPVRELRSPVTLIVKNGLVEEVLGKEEFALQLEKKISERFENRNIAEFGIGTNNRAKRADNILESEKILGTIHIALGDNSSFGGMVRTPFHQDFVFFQPTVLMTSKHKKRTAIMKQGRFAEGLL
ncbi:MAG: peptidase [Nitrospirae bacterium]|nr:peptidase [Nitrospirota bacterium]